MEDEGGRCIKLLPWVQTGLPDRMVLLPSGFLVFVETKSQGGRLKPAQVHWRRVLVDLGFRWRLVRDEVGIEALLREWQEVVDSTDPLA